MALNIATMKAKKSPTAITTTRGGRETRDLGPNFFLDPKWEFNLKNSYDKSEPYSIVVVGTYVTAKKVKGKQRGEEFEKLTGDAADAVTLLRKAGLALKIGVAIREYTGKGPDGETIPKGHVLIKYQGQKQRVTKAKDVPVPVAPVNVPVNEPSPIVSDTDPTEGS